MLDILSPKKLFQQQLCLIFWVPTFRQLADGRTKAMADELFGEFLEKGTIRRKETPKDAKGDSMRGGRSE